ncbi:hypothetical protein [Parasphingorhabdus cellanae]|uniref:Uncharacterized protein n=1 Tax=Parasphingorhabdus cellanae TaxID=2806553 RepID=A0ABX7T5C5_9SPHN|nr:hypothetical protein [Parasphingorhabdus cellanae]QTD56794.1 hypothetical protein J4G78_04235 [Parasphingorhabdus cellanae]
MKNVTLAAAAALISTTATPAFADSAIDTETMVETAAPQQHQAIDLPIGHFNLAGVTTDQGYSFMATMVDIFEPGYRVQDNGARPASKPNESLASLLVSEEFSYRSTAQDSGVDAVNPGRFISSSVRSDYLSDAGPAAADKSSIGIRFGF